MIACVFVSYLLLPLSTSCLLDAPPNWRHCVRLWKKKQGPSVDLKALALSSGPSMDPDHAAAAAVAADVADAAPPTPMMPCEITRMRQSLRGQHIGWHLLSFFSFFNFLGTLLWTSRTHLVMRRCR